MGGRRLVWLGHRKPRKGMWRPSKPAIPGSNPGGRTIRWQPTVSIPSLFVKAVCFWLFCLIGACGKLGLGLFSWVVLILVLIPMLRLTFMLMFISWFMSWLMLMPFCWAKVLSWLCKLLGTMMWV